MHAGIQRGCQTGTETGRPGVSLAQAQPSGGPTVLVHPVQYGAAMHLKALHS
jgi:hypothetical protein